MTYVNVKDYGAVGDGVTDDWQAIQDAKAAAGLGGTVFFPLGDYALSQSMWVGARTFIGEQVGDKRTIIRASASMDAVCYAETVPTRMEHLTLAASGCRVGLRVYQGYHAVLIDVRASGATEHGFELIRCAHLEGHILRAESNGQAGIHIGSGNGLSLYSPRCTNNTGDGIYVRGYQDEPPGETYDATRVEIRDILCEVNGGHGLRLSGVGGGTYDAGITENNTGDGVFVTGSHNVKIRDLHSIGPGRAYRVQGGSKTVLFDGCTAANGDNISHAADSVPVVTNCYVSSKNLQANPLPVVQE